MAENTACTSLPRALRERAAYSDGIRPGHTVLLVGQKKFGSGEDVNKTSCTVASFHEMKCAVAARLSEGEARVSKPQANESME